MTKTRWAVVKSGSADTAGRVRSVHRYYASAERASPATFHVILPIEGVRKGDYVRDWRERYAAHLATLRKGR